MSAPAIPQHVVLQQGNGQVALSWDIQAGATSYAIQRSTDGVTFSALGTTVAPQYVDTTVTLGNNYYYQVASVNGSGTSQYSAAQSIVPTLTGEMTLGQVRLASQQRADRVDSPFVTTAEWNSYINQSYFELYDLLVTVYEDYFIAPPVHFTTNGNQFLYPLPDGVTVFQHGDGTNFVPQSLYKLRGVDLGLQTANNAYVTVSKFNFMDRNRFVYPNSASTIYGVFNMQYRMMGKNIEFIPTPSNNQRIRLWYTPRLAQLLLDTDIMDGVSGWTEYVIVDAAIKALQKEESDVSALMMQKQALLVRIQDSAMNRDEGQPDRITDVRANGMWGGSGSSDGWNGSSGGW